MIVKILRDECQARANVYRLLAGALIEEPQVDYLQALRTPEAIASLTELGVSFDEDFTAPDLDQLQDALATEFAVLFVTPGGCPAVESVRLTGRFQQEPLFAVREFYRRSGFQMTETRFAVFEDQLGVELMFVAELLDQSAALLAACDNEGYERLEKVIKRFWVQHPGKWVRGYASLLGRATQHSFYREIAHLLQSFSEWEIKLLGIKIDDVDGGKAVVAKAEIPLEFNPDEPVCGGCEHGRKSDDLLAQAG